MNINTDASLTVAEADRNFLQAAQLADKNGEVVILKGDRPKYLLVDLDETSYFSLTDEEKIDIVAARILKKHRAAFEELAK